MRHRPLLILSAAIVHGILLDPDARRQRPVGTGGRQLGGAVPGLGAKRRQARRNTAAERTRRCTNPKIQGTQKAPGQQGSLKKLHERPTGALESPAERASASRRPERAWTCSCAVSRRGVRACADRGRGGRASSYLGYRDLVVDDDLCGRGRGGDDQAGQEGKLDGEEHGGPVVEKGHACQRHT